MRRTSKLPVARPLLLLTRRADILSQGNDMINLMVFCEHEDENFSFYRAWGPLGQLRKQVPDINLIEPPKRDLTWRDLRGIDITFFQRPSQTHHLSMVR